MPTRNGRNGMLFTKDGIINMRNKKWETDFSPIEADGASAVDTLYSKAYLRHLFHAQELLAMQIASIHNLAFYLWLVGEARKHIIAGDFSTWKPMMVKKSVNKIIKNEKQSINKTAGLVYHQEILGDIRICHCIDYLNCGGVRLQREDGQADGA